jgi:hypothetical protein
LNRINENKMNRINEIRVYQNKSGLFCLSLRLISSFCSFETRSDYSLKESGFYNRLIG